jgi:hypothetical protein
MSAGFAEMSRPLREPEEKVAVDGLVLLETGSKRNIGERLVTELVFVDSGPFAF